MGREISGPTKPAQSGLRIQLPLAGSKGSAGVQNYPRSDRQVRHPALPKPSQIRKPLSYKASQNLALRWLLTVECRSQLVRSYLLDPVHHRSLAKKGGN